MELEEWRPVVGYEGFYEISRDGAVRNAKTKHVLKVQTDTKGRLWVALHRNEGRMKPGRIHRLLAQAFLPPPADGQTDVCHNNGQLTDNRLENLRWDTHAANMADIRRHGTARNQNTGIERCKSGHEFTEENTYVYRNERACRTCRRAYQRKWRESCRI